MARTLLILGAAAAADGCADVDVPAEEPTLAAAQPAALSFDPTALQSGQRRSLVEGIKAAENQWFTSTGRLLISGDDGIYELVSSGSGSYSALPVHEGEACQFGGLTELHGTLYANCYDGTDSKLFAAPLAEKLTFRAIYSLTGTPTANGLTTDGSAHLFVASTMEGTVIRLQVSASDPMLIQARDEFAVGGLLTPNGVKFREGRLYWTGLFAVSSAEPAAGGGKRELFSDLTFFDDLYVDDAGILVADYLNGGLVATDLNGARRGASPSGMFDGPSSVLPCAGRLGLPEGGLIVTERGGNRVSIWQP
jgi:hypothetical protein